MREMMLPDVMICKNAVFSQNVMPLTKKLAFKIRRGPKLEDCAFANFGNSSGTEEEPSQKKERKMGENRKKKSMLPRRGIEPGTCR